MKIDVLDHGHVEFIEAWGHGGQYYHTVEFPLSVDYERGVVAAARQSTQGSFRGWDQDEKLLRFLYDNKHYTPFEFAGMVIEVQAPIFVFREWHRHRTQSYNEMSARYAPLPDISYVPTVERLMMNSKDNKQAGTIKNATELTEHNANVFRDGIQDCYEAAEEFYQNWLFAGVPKELARICLPVGRYSRMRASANLRNWLAFLTLRMDPNAQWEIRQFANAVGRIVAQQFPHTWGLFSK